MKNEIRFSSDDKVAVIAPHPDDECLGAAAPLLKIPKQTDIYVLTDGCYGNPNRSIEEEATLRKQWFEEEMAIVKPNKWFWLGYEDKSLSDTTNALSQIDFSKYTKMFIPWNKSLHPDHRAAANMCLEIIVKCNQNGAQYYYYEVCAPFYNPRHYIDITDYMDKKIELIRCHKDMTIQEDLIRTLNHFRAVQLMEHPDCVYVEAYEKVKIIE